MNDISKRTAYCLNCNCKQPYITRHKYESVSVRGIEIEYIEHNAYCAVCGAEVYVPEINDMNAREREKAFLMLFIL